MTAKTISIFGVLSLATGSIMVAELPSCQTKLELSHIMTDATYVNFYMHASGARGRNQGIEVSKKKGGAKYEAWNATKIISNENMHDSQHAEN